MLCDNCGKREANVRYSENINGRRKELNLCEECSKKLGLTKDFNMPIDFSSFFGGFIEDFGTTDFMPMINQVKDLKCKTCGYTFEDVANRGSLGCEDCYEIFENKLDPIIKRIHGANRHTGRTGKIIDSEIENKINKENNKTNPEQNNKLDKLKEDLKKAIKEERYEDAAKLRDEIKKQEG